MSNYIIYSQTGKKCPWCEKAATLLDEKGIPYQLRPLDRDELLEVAARASMSTVPIVFDGDRIVGGYTELSEEFNPD